MKIAVVGAGPAGVMAALKSSEKHEVLLLDGNEKILKKLLLTGNGKCNYWNSNITIQNYHTNHPVILEKQLEKQEEVFSYLLNLGIYPKIKNGYYYPYSLTSTSVREILKKQLEKRNVEILTDFKVEKVEKQEGKFIIQGKKTFLVDKVVFAPGSCAAPKTGSDGSFYPLLKDMGHSILEPLPALVPLKTKESTKDLEGLRTEVFFTLYKNGCEVKKERGEIQFTEYGISGICTLNSSGLATRFLKEKNLVHVSLDLLPDIDNVLSFLNDRNQQLSSASVEELLESIFHYKLLFAILKRAGIIKEKKWDLLSEQEKENIASQIKHFSFEIVGSLDFDRAQVATGGVFLEEIDPVTFASKKVEGLYLIGEILDVDGICGGFNLAYAFLSGYMAGEALCLE